jgi:hypothetical protein
LDARELVARISRGMRSRKKIAIVALARRLTAGQALGDAADEHALA